MIILIIVLLLIFFVLSDEILTKNGSGPDKIKTVDLFDFYIKGVSHPIEYYKRNIYIIGFVQEEKDDIFNEFSKNKKILVKKVSSFKNLKNLRKFVGANKNIPILFTGTNILGGQKILFPNYNISTYTVNDFLKEPIHIIINEIPSMIRNFLWKIKNSTWAITYINGASGSGKTTLTKKIETAVDTDTIDDRVIKRNVADNKHEKEGFKELMKSIGNGNYIYIGIFETPMIGIADYTYYIDISSIEVYKRLQKRNINIICQNKDKIFNILDSMKNSDDSIHRKEIHTKLEIRNPTLIEPSGHAFFFNNFKKFHTTCGFVLENQEELFLTAKITEIFNNYKTDALGQFSVFQGSRLIFENQTLPPNYVKLKKQNLYRIYSMTKPLTAYCVLQYVDPNKTLGQINGKVFGNIASVKIRDLLDHTSDLYDFVSDVVYCNYGGVIKKNLKGNKFYFPDFKDYELRLENESRGGKFWYNNTGYDVLGKVIEFVTGKNLRYHFQKLFNKLGMNETYFHSDLPKLGNHLAFDYNDPNIIYEDYHDFAGNCCLISTAEDYNKFVMMPKSKSYKSMYFYNNGIFEHEGGGDFVPEFVKGLMKHSPPLTRNYFCNSNGFTVILFQIRSGKRPLIENRYGKPSEIIMKINDFLFNFQKKN